MNISDCGYGHPYPLGAALHADGVNFSVYSKNAFCVELLLFDSSDAVKPAHAIRLDSRKNRTYHYWHVFVRGLKAGQIYGYKALGPNEPERGIRFYDNKVLIDPYSRLVTIPADYTREPSNPAAMKSVVTDLTLYDWEGDQPLGRPFSDTMIYELHIRGFTRHPSSRVASEKAGTYAGLIEKIPYLMDLGITAVELMPVFGFDAADAPPGKINYWGYAPVSFFAPHRAYSSRRDLLGPIDEFRDMVKALHRAGLEVILDVVFNHTAEGGPDGPTFCYRGLANDTYYILQKDPNRYADYSGCGNTLNANQSIVRRMILDSLRYWVTDMHVDGFRFDLASVLARDESGIPLPSPPIIWDIESDPVLAGTKMIAEAWDAAGLYQVGSFVGDAWKEWNGRFRDDIRRFVKGDRQTISNLAARLLGSPDLYGKQHREPEQSVNFVTCHDGFTLNDLVSYNSKHNEANGENNRDGMNDSHSWNCGVEGPSDDKAIESLRTRQIKNLITINLVAIGTPMLLMGDEMRRSQRGNNNAYCQDNDISWLDWGLLDQCPEIHRFTKMMLAARASRDPLSDVGITLNQFLKQMRVDWHGVALNQPDWSADSHSLAFTTAATRAHYMIHGMFNAYWEPLTFALPAAEDDTGMRWRRWVDTALETPHDICKFSDAPVVLRRSYVVQARSCVLLARPF